MGEFARDACKQVVQVEGLGHRMGSQTPHFAGMLAKQNPLPPT